MKRGVFGKNVLSHDGSARGWQALALALALALSGIFPL